MRTHTHFVVIYDYTYKLLDGAGSSLFFFIHPLSKESFCEIPLNIIQGVAELDILCS